MTNNLLILNILVPFIAGVLILIVPDRMKLLKNVVTVGTMLINLCLAAFLFKLNTTVTIPWMPFKGFELSFSLYNYSAFTILAAAFFGFLIALYSSAFLQTKTYSKLFYFFYIITFGFLNGAVLADNLFAMLFFWEGLLAALFGIIAIGSKGAFKTATKAFIIVGISDLCMMAGIIMCGSLAGTYTISQIHLTVAGLGGLAFIFLVIGAIAKAGSMPFHTWIPDAAIDAPMPAMAMLPGALEKLIGIYFLYRISLNMFKLELNSWASYTLMTIGAITIVFAVMMALIQKDFKKLLSYHVISQIGYMVLGIGTLVPAGIIGGLFHMINNALYKSCLFLTGGSVEKQTGTTDLKKLGGIGRQMPITFICFIITAAAISGVPPLNGFFSKELVYDGALERGKIFYLAALIGSFFTAASFLKLGHAAFLGKRSEENKNVKEAPISMLIPMIVIAGGCILFGLYNALPIGIFQSILGPKLMKGTNFVGAHFNILLVMATVIVLIGAMLNHLYGARKTGSGLGAVDHIHYAPILKNIYAGAEKRYFDPFNIGMNIVKVFSAIASWSDKAIDWVYNVFAVRSAEIITGDLKKLHNGNYRAYILWSIAAAAGIVIFLIKTMI